MLRFAPPEDLAPLDAALARLDSYDALLFSSANAVRCFTRHAAKIGRSLAGLSAEVLCVGPQTAEVARGAGLPVHRIPERRSDAEGLLALVERQLPPKGRRFLLPCADLAREVLPEGLRAAGATVDAVTVYRTLPPDMDPERLRAPLIAGEWHALTFTSPSTVEHFAALLDEPAREAARRCVVAAIGPVTAKALRSEGLGPDLTAARASVKEMVAALAARFSQDVEGGAR
jgi:uroporphyrinogen III methyltransferase/synthase